MSTGSPTRRTVLRAGGLAGLALLAGCTTSAGSGSAPSPTPSPSSTPTPGPASEDDPGLPTGDGGATGGTRLEGTGGPGVSLVRVTEPAAPLAAAVTLVEPVATDESPPLLRTTLTNTGDVALRVGEGRAARFQYVHDTSGRLALLPAEGEWAAEPGCWRLADGVAINEEYRTFELAPGASATADLALYAAATGDACLPVGEHTFRTPYQLLDDELAATASGEWGFTLLLE